jgi:hypothetical protein
MKDIVNAAIIQPTEEAARRVFNTLKALGKSAAEVLRGAIEIGGSALALAFTLILEWIPGSYRQLTAAELAHAQNVFGSTIDLAKVRLAVMSPAVDLLQLANNERPFTTMYLINFASWNDLSDATLIHELTHVWQGVVKGPFYMVEALHAQEFGDGYDYNGEAGLAAAAGDFEKFNREQQAAIVEDYFDRRFLQGRPEADYAAWKVYADKVYA